MSLINSANIVLLASLYLMTSTHLKYSMLFELLKNKTKCMDFAVLSVTGTKYRVTRVYWRAQSTQSLSVCAETFRNETFEPICKHLTCEIMNLCSGGIKQLCPLQCIMVPTSVAVFVFYWLFFRSTFFFHQSLLKAKPCIFLNCHSHIHCFLL